MERGFIPHDFETFLQVLHFCSPPFSCSIRYQEREQGSGGGGEEQEERERRRSVGLPKHSKELSLRFL